MQVEIHTFKEWNYPFIAQDYEGNAGADCSNLKLGGIVVEEGDELSEIISQVADFIDKKIPAIMIELYHVWGSILMEDVDSYAREILTANGYTDLESYEHRLSYGKYTRREE